MNKHGDRGHQRSKQKIFFVLVGTYCAKYAYKRHKKVESPKNNPAPFLLSDLTPMHDFYVLEIPDTPRHLVTQMNIHVPFRNNLIAVVACDSGRKIRRRNLHSAPPICVTLYNLLYKKPVLQKHKTRNGQRCGFCREE